MEEGSREARFGKLAGGGEEEARHAVAPCNMGVNYSKRQHQRQEVDGRNCAQACKVRLHDKGMVVNCAFGQKNV